MEEIDQEVARLVSAFKPERIRDPGKMAAFFSDFQNLILKYWEKHPNYRFGQILTIFEAFLLNKGIKDAFYIEDPDFLKELEEFISR